MKVFLVCMLLACTLFANGQYSYEYIFDDTENQLVFHGIETEYGDYFLVGQIGNSNSTHDAYIIKVGHGGDTLSQRITNDENNAYLSYILQLENNTYLLIGQSGPINSNYYNNMWFVKMNSDLEILDERYYQLPSSYYFSIGLSYAILKENGNVIISGSAKYTPHSDLCTVVINSDLDTLNTKFYPYQFSQSVDDWVEIPGTSDYLMLGGKIGLYGTSAQAIRFDSSLNIVSIQNLPIDLTVHGSIGHWKGSDEYLHSGVLRDTTGTGTDDDFSIAVQIVDTSATIIKHRYFGKPDTTDYSAWRNSMAYFNDTTIYVGGFTIIFGATYDPLPTFLELYMIDNDLNLLGYSQYGGDANYQMWGVIPSSDGGCLMYGTRYGVENGPYERDVYIKKVLRKEINIITSIEEYAGGEFQTSAYPNPVGGILNIPLKSSWNSNNIHLRIVDSEGRTVYDKQIIGKGNLITVNVTSLNPGPYIYSVYDNKQLVVSGKFIKHNLH